MKEYESSVMFGMTFIFSLFSSALAGYFVCSKVMNYSQEVVSGLCG